MKSPRDQEIVSWWGGGKVRKKIISPHPHHEIISWSLGDQLFSFIDFKTFSPLARRLSRGGGGGKEFCVLTSNYLVQWISFNFNFQRFFKLVF